MNNGFRYTILPFTFKKFDHDNFLLVNESGDYQFMPPKDFDSLLRYQLPKDGNLYRSLRSSQLVADEDLDLSIELTATKLRTKKRFLKDFTTLHMMVITVRCNHHCEYCQVSSEAEDACKFDMTPATAQRIVEYIFRTPSKNIKIEFQGGEPLINWKTVHATVEYAEELNKTLKKHLEFVICTNLTLVNDDQLKFLRDHNVLISTSLDGNRKTHDKNRKLRNGGSSYDLFMKKFDLARSIYGNDISALMATTSDNLWVLDTVVDEYVRNGFHGVFLRSLNPYGFASENIEKLGYSMEDFVQAYGKALDYIINLNLSGKSFVEYYTTLLVSRILTPFSTGFVDLQSPAGTGICGVIYDYNGDVYPSDEARMLSRMGDSHFKMGNVFQNSYQDIFLGKTLTELIDNSCVETLPGCASCVYRTYCGADPIRNYLECKDIIGHRPSSAFCKKHTGIFDYLFKKLRYGSEEELDVLWSWVTRRALREVAGETN